MATTAVHPTSSVDILNVLQNSIALALSRPLVELSQHCSGAALSATSAIVTRFRSPPLTPLTRSLPTRVLTVWLIPKEAIVTSRRVLAKSSRPMPPGMCLGALAIAANSKVCPTLNMGKCTSTSAVYVASPRKSWCIVAGSIPW